MEFFESEGKIVKTETIEKKLVGRIDCNYYFCDTIFDYKDGFKGATATVLCPVSREDYEQRTDPYDSDTLEHFEDCWQQAVHAGTTTKGLDAWVEEVLAVDGDEAVFDFSGYDYWDILRDAVPELTEEDYPVFECVGGGRSFSPNMQWDEIYDEELWKRIKEIEAN
uniref:Uncharacterized protein n=1 Tax=viral metagenome TaxID=1070528 RepID=A0A6M3KD57_9ZZZZ